MNKNGWVGTVGGFLVSLLFGFLCAAIVLALVVLATIV